jgi:hypothetical protein
MDPFIEKKNQSFAWKSNIFDTFSVLELNPNEKKNTFSRSVSLIIDDGYFEWLFRLLKNILLKTYKNSRKTYFFRLKKL